MHDPVRVRVVPRRSLLVTASLSVAFVMLPLFGVLYWFAADRGLVLPVLVAHLSLLLVAVILVLRQLSVDTVVTATEIRGRGIFSPMLRVPLERVATVDLVPVYVGQAAEPVVQLLVRDAEGTRLYRMRGNFWRRADLERVADALPVLPHRESEPLAMREFFRDFPGSSYWFENRPVVVSLLLVGSVGFAVAAVTAALRLIGVPLGFAG